MIAVFVPGKAETQGSLSFKGYRGGKPILTSDNNRVYRWRDLVRKAILSDDGKPRHRFDGPVHIELEFVLPRTQGMSKKASLSAHKAKTSDIDKLERAVLDAITDSRRDGPGVIPDDRRVVSVMKSKRYAKLDETPGCHIEILTAFEHQLREEGRRDMMDLAMINGGVAG